MTDPITVLPDDLAERARLHRSGKNNVNSGGGCIVYWMQAAIRGHDNPALDAARALADALELPLLAVFEARSDQPYASDRLVVFALEAVRDAAVELAELGVPFRFYVQERRLDPTVIAILAERCSVLVTEDMPVDPNRAAVRHVAVASSAPILLVDTACILPMRAVGKRHDRAFKFRKATERARADRMVWPYAGYQGGADFSSPEGLPEGYVPLLVEPATVAASMEIDHLVGPVADTPGGSRAGYARWTRFRDGALKTYARSRNDALKRDAVSRMSPYLHGGHVSPFVLAREAAAVGGAGADKFLDEFLIWRELAYNWCYYGAGHDDAHMALPAWALATLEERRADPRPALLDWETLARGCTGDALWDAAQASLVRHGELHNNLRMTWGKQILQWTQGPHQALAMLLDLNHRYALDGCDPNSYGGLLWCLGQFDRPFEPPQPIFGTVRPRSTEVHARRLDVGAYRERVMQPNGKRERIAVIGAGLAGLICARALQDHGHAVTVIDKGRGLGGRLATRRVDSFAFDHGAQYFTARDPGFRRHVDAWVEQGFVAEWAAAGERSDDRRWVGAPRMSAMGRHLARDLEVKGSTRVATVRRIDDGWRLTAETGDDLGSFDRVVVAVPAPQAVDLLVEAPDVQAAAAAATYHPCWALLVAARDPIDLPATLRPQHPAIAWIGRNETKPGRDTGEAAGLFVVHARADWSTDNLECTAEAARSMLWTAFGEIAGGNLAEPLYAAAHRWRFALVDRPFGQAVAADDAQGIYACGDWCLEGRIEAAYLSGAAAAGRILGRNAVESRAD